jgi:hypothetical protein
VEVVNKKIYIFADKIGLRYDPETRVWSEIAGLPLELCMPGSFSRDDAIQLLGGMAHDGSENHRFTYDIARDRWTRNPQTPGAKEK